jgi:hypothetical protein
MVQLDLFTPQPTLSRRTDKATSHESADSTRVKLGMLQQRCMFMLADKQLTAMEVATLCSDYYGKLAESYRKRFHELVRDGLIEELPARTCTVTGSSATVYRKVSK